MEPRYALSVFAADTEYGKRALRYQSKYYVSILAAYEHLRLSPALLARASIPDDMYCSGITCNPFPPIVEVSAL